MSLYEGYDEPTITERFEKLLLNEYLADVYFLLVSDNDQVQRIPAHKLVLSAGSRVFDTMFNGSLPEIHKEIPVPDVRPEAFLELLKFLYTDINRVKITEMNLISVLYVAKKYQVSGLEVHCFDCLEKTLCILNVYEYLSDAAFYHLEDIQEECFQYIDVNAKDFFSSDKFTSLSLEILCVILKRKTLCIGELDVFNAVLCWSVFECGRWNLLVTPENQRSVLGDTLKLIRFPNMKEEEFNRFVGPTCLLNEEDELSMLRFFNYGTNVTNFIHEARVYSGGTIYSVCRFQPVLRSVYKFANYTKCEVRFSVDHQIYLTGCMFYLQCSADSAYENLIISTKGVPREVECKGYTDWKQPWGVNREIKFERHFRILPKMNYVAEIFVKGTFLGGKSSLIEMTEEEEQEDEEECACSHTTEKSYVRVVKTNAGDVTFKFFEFPNVHKIPKLLFFV